MRFQPAKEQTAQEIKTLMQEVKTHVDDTGGIIVDTDGVKLKARTREALIPDKFLMRSNRAFNNIQYTKNFIINLDSTSIISFYSKDGTPHGQFSLPNGYVVPVPMNGSGGYRAFVEDETYLYFPIKYSQNGQVTILRLKKTYIYNQSLTNTNMIAIQSQTSGDDANNASVGFISVGTTEELFEYNGYLYLSSIGGSPAMYRIPMDNFFAQGENVTYFPSYQWQSGRKAEVYLGMGGTSDPNKILIYCADGSHTATTYTILVYLFNVETKIIEAYIDINTKWTSRITSVMYMDIVDDVAVVSFNNSTNTNMVYEININTLEHTLIGSYLTIWGSVYYGKHNGKHSYLTLPGSNEFGVISGANVMYFGGIKTSNYNAIPVYSGLTLGIPYVNSTTVFRELHEKKIYHLSNLRSFTMKHGVEVIGYEEVE